MKSTDVIDIYNSEYFLSQVDGFNEFAEFDGKFDSLFPRYQRNIELLELLPEHNLLEIGCGRGEVCIFHGLRGGKAKGVDYSADAIKLARTKSAELGVKVEFVESSFERVNEAPETYDRILASEFIEHISYTEGEQFFKKAYLLLKPNGRLLVFTMPNTLYRKFGYPIYRLYSLLKGKYLPKVMDDTLSEHYRLYHLNEQNYYSLCSFAKQAGFEKFTVGYDIEKEINNNSSSFKKFIKLAISRTPLRHIFYCNLYLLAVK